MTVEEALKLDLSDDLKKALANYALDSFVVIDQNDVVHIAENNEHNRRLFNPILPDFATLVRTP